MDPSRTWPISIEDQTCDHNQKNAFQQTHEYMGLLIRKHDLSFLLSTQTERDLMVLVMKMYADIEA